MRKFNWGIIGTGRIARSFAEALKGCEDSVLYAVGSRSIEKAEAFAGEFGFEKSYGSYGELAADDNIDAVYIATPMASHFADAMLCIQNGRNVLCEKSIALNADQCSRMISAAQEKDVFFMEAMWMKCRPTYLKALEWINSGAIGRVRYISADFCCFVPYSPGDRLFDPGCGGGALLDLGVYPITLAADVLGDSPDEIISLANIVHGVDMSNSITLKYKDSAAVLRSGFEMQTSSKALISGDNGTIVFEGQFHCTEEITLYDRSGSLTEHSVLPVLINGYEYEIMEVQRCIAGGLKESPLVKHSSTLAVMKIMDKCRSDWGLCYPGEC